VKRGPGAAALACALAAAASSAIGQEAPEAPLILVLPRQEQLRQLEVRADLHMIRKEFLDAVDLYQQALELAPRSAVMLNKTGIAYHQLSRLEEARKFYERSARADERYAPAWNNLGTIYFREKRYKKAAEYYRRALRWNPGLAAVHSNLGAALFALKRFEPALAEFRAALQLDSEIFVRHSPFGATLQDLAVQDRARFYFLLAKSYAGMGEAELCVRFLRRALEDGFPVAEAQADPAFDPVRQDEAFQTLFAAPPPTLPR
jgi:tetratricopeptide (TPR) repeat protein